MGRPLRVIAALIVVASAVLGGVLIGARLGGIDDPLGQETPTSEPGAGDSNSLPIDASPPLLLNGADRRVGFGEVAAAVAPAVINISSERIITTQRRVPTPFGWDPFFEFFGQRWQTVPQQRRQQSLGSGVIVADSGVILTANHVVEGAREIMAVLPDGRSVAAKLLGNDPATDVAVLKVDAADLPSVPLGNSDSARIGDVVLAFGNPFGLGQTVTMGIISATGRSSVGLVDYENFIQTDAAINPGNSGGALVDVQGRLIGINTAIFSRSGGYQGIGFAVPINMARSVMDGILSTGSITRGWVGLSYQDIDETMARALGLPSTQGALINDITSGSPAADVGLERGDVVVSFDGQPVANSAQLRRLIALGRIGQSVEIVVWRDGREDKRQLTVESYETELELSEEISHGTPLEGLVVEELDAAGAGRIGLRADTRGVIIKDIVPNSPADRAGFRIGDAILEINRESVVGVSNFRRLVERIGDRPAVMLLSRDGRLYYLSFPT
jgi:serine protease Do